MTKPTTLKAIPYAGEGPSSGDNFLKQLRVAVTYMALGDLTPNKRNPHTHSDAQVEQIRKSIREFGLNLPIAQAEGVIYGGHAVCLAAAKEGYSEVPTVDISHLTEPKRRAFGIAVNKIATNAGWDENLLTLELNALLGEGIDVAGLLGFNEAELDRLLTTADPNGEAPAPPLPATPVTRIGDVWQLGTHRIVCGDSTNADDVAKLLGEEKPFLMVTDPPYGVEYDAAWRDGIVRANGSVAKIVGAGKVKNDDVADWSAAWSLFPGDVAYVWHADRAGWETEKGLRDCGFEKRALIVWNKGKAPISRGHYHYQHEGCFYLVRIGRTGHWHGDRKQSTVWDISTNSGWDSKKDKGGDAHTEHSTQKPVDCMRRPMFNNSEKGDAVYDPFLGSGTTVIAAERAGRRAFGVELNPGYVDVAIERWEKETGRKANLEGSTMTFAEVKAERLGASSAP